MTAEPPGTRQFARIECNESAAAGVLWLMAAVLPLLGFGAIWIAGVPLRFNVPAREFNPLVVLPIVAALAGLFFLASAIFITLRLRKFGTSTLTLDKRPRIGGHLQGRITSTVDLAPPSEWRLVLQCIETIKALGDKRVYQTELIRWEFNATLPAAESLRRGIPVSIAIPEDCLDLRDPLEKARKKRGALRWVLQLKTQRRGLDYLASFAIPIRHAADDRIQYSKNASSG